MGAVYNFDKEFKQDDFAKVNYSILIWISKVKDLGGIPFVSERV